MVHVMGAPDKEHLEHDEVLCTDARTIATEVVYHCKCTPIGFGWVCTTCGESSATEEVEYQ